MEEIDRARTAWDAGQPWGNRVADLWRRTFATAEDPLEGIQLGWRDLERSTAWVRDVIETAESYREDLEGGGDVIECAWSVAELVCERPETAGTSARLEVLGELPSWVAAEDVTELISPKSAAEAAGAILEYVARQLAEAYIGGMGH